MVICTEHPQTMATPTDTTTIVTDMKLACFYYRLYSTFFSSIMAKDTVDSTVHDFAKHTASWRQRHMFVNRLLMAIKHYCYY